MKPHWPYLLVAIGTLSPAAGAQAPAPAPPASSAEPPSPTGPEPTEPGPAEPSTTEPSTTEPSTTEPSTTEPEPIEPSPSAESPAATETAPTTPASPGALFAAPPAAEKPAEPPPAPATTPRPESSNRGHLRLGVRAGLVAPFGWVAQGTPQLEVAGMGAGYGLDLSFGIAEQVTLGVYGDLLVQDRVPDCAECAPLTYGLGLSVRYHLVQGLRFDPWASYGIGAIGLGGVAPDGEGSYLGIEWMRLTFGGDWYALRNLGLGPYMELGAGSFWQAPAGDDPGGVHFRFQMGMRIAIDFPGR